jgi:hypothetical protein
MTTNRGRHRTGVAVKTGIERIIDLVKNDTPALHGQTDAKCRLLRRGEHATCRNRFCGEHIIPGLRQPFPWRPEG